MPRSPVAIASAFANAPVWSVWFALLWVAGCAPKLVMDGPWEQIWPPVESEHGASASSTPHANTASSESSRSHAARKAPVEPTDSEPAAGTSAAARAVPDRLSTDGGSAIVADDRLTAEQRQLLADQFSANTARGTVSDTPESASPRPDSQTPATHPASSSSTPTPPVESRSIAAPSPTPPPPGVSPRSTAPAATREPSRESTPPNASPNAPQTSTASGGTDSVSSSQPETRRPPSGSESAESSTAIAQGADSERKPSSNETGSSNGAAATEADAGGVEPGQWRRDLRQAIASLEKELADAAVESDERNRLEAALRMLYVTDGRRDDAARPIEGLDARGQDFWKMALAGLYELTDPNGPPIPSRRSKLAIHHFREAVQHLAATSPLEVRNPAICRRVDSFGQFEEFEPYAFAPEQEVILYVEVLNFAFESSAEGFETELHGAYQILTSDGHPIADYDLPDDKQVSRNLRTDYFIPYRVFLPKDLEPGSYKIRVMLEDKKGKKFGQSTAVSFQIRK